MRFSSAGHRYPHQPEILLPNSELPIRSKTFNRLIHREFSKDVQVAPVPGGAKVKSDDRTRAAACKVFQRSLRPPHSRRCHGAGPISPVCTG
ncbi:MAG TPA: hypothetical protein PLK47_07795, partial [Plasticicumulans sp.]|nr:hypothetical protein [Plasticicumulans sp.]